MRDRNSVRYRKSRQELVRQRVRQRGPAEPVAGGARFLPLLLAGVILAACVGLAATRLVGAVRQIGVAPTPGAAAVQASSIGTPGQSQQVVTAQIVVRTGDTLSNVANRLQAAGIIGNATLFRLDVRIKGLDPNIQPGTYQLSSNMSTTEIVTALHTVAEKPQATVLFKEGWRLEEDAAALQKAGVVSSAAYMSAATSADAYRARYSFLADAPKGATLNGYLFPDTYRFNKPTPAADVIARQLARFGQVVTPAMIATAKQQHRSLFDVLIIASIVEREAKVPSERPLIAGVYWNRYDAKQGMFSDPTVQYALGWDPAQKTWWRLLSKADLQVTSPYNTYKVPGLPPGPICNPGLASIQASLQPKGNYLYMVAKNDGSGTHAFATTLAQHNANVAKYQH